MVIGLFAAERNLPVIVDSPDIAGVRICSLQPFDDIRGRLIETHRDSWALAPKPLQWDYIFTSQRVLRGAHVHRIRHDYLVSVEGKATFGLTDLRRDSPTFRQAMTFDVSGEEPSVVIVPPGVIHSFYTHTPYRYLYGLTAYFDGLDHLGCRFDDPALGVKWPDPDPILLDRDAQLPDFETLSRQFQAAGGVQTRE